MRIIDETFAIMRRLDPIVRAGPTTIVALNEDVKEVLGDPARFTTHDYAAGPDRSSRRLRHAAGRAAAVCGGG